MNSLEYEIVTSEIAKSVFRRLEGFPCENISVGKKSKWLGQSGFRHQIDVAIQGENDIIMVECKYWNRNVVNVSHVLTFTSRIHDIRPTLTQILHPVMVASTRYQSGCYKLAKHYGIALEVIESAGNFAFSYKGMSALGKAPRSGALALG